VARAKVAIRSQRNEHANQGHNSTLNRQELRNGVDIPYSKSMSLQWRRSRAERQGPETRIMGLDKRGISPGARSR
jgi:hypothetical protein